MMPATFWNKVTKTTSCWLWMGAKNAQGYGHFYHGGRMVKAHRLHSSFFAMMSPTTS
jgi:hypothetical protein